MAACCRVYDSPHLQADCQEPESFPEPSARQSSMGYLDLFTHMNCLMTVTHSDYLIPVCEMAGCHSHQSPAYFHQFDLMDQCQINPLIEN